MLPVIAIVGRPNVGKSTLFNRLTRTRDALVHDMPGVTRDRQYGEGKHRNQRYILIDTGGLEYEENSIDDMTTQQAWLAIEEADSVVFVVDAKAGITSADQSIAEKLRRISKPIILAINKAENLDYEEAKFAFYELGFEHLISISAAHGRNTDELMDSLPIDWDAEIEEEEQDPGIRVAIVGRPNVGKSTMVNRILGEERVIAFDKSGTTRDSIAIPFERDNTDYVLIDTAGIRRRNKVKDVVEKFSVIKALQAVEEADIVVFVVDARENLSHEDLRLLDFVVNSGRGLVLAINKWDGMDDYERSKVKNEIDRRLAFVDFADIHFVSALHGTGIGNLFKSINAAYACFEKEYNTAMLTRILEKAVAAHQPPLVKGRRIKLRFAHPGGNKPPTIVINGKQTESVPGSYKRYLNKCYRKALNLVGTPIKLVFKTDDNPYS